MFKKKSYKDITTQTVKRLKKEIEKIYEEEDLNELLAGITLICFNSFGILFLSCLKSEKREEFVSDHFHFLCQQLEDTLKHQIKQMQKVDMQ
jgi:hypothetical protein